MGASKKLKSRQRKKHEHDDSDAGRRLVGGQVSRRPIEVRIRDEIERECDRQRAELSRKEGADAQVRLLGDILGQLICQTEFVTLLRSAGFANIPRPVHQRLLMQARGIHADPRAAATGTAVAGYLAGRATNEMETATVLTSENLCKRTLQALSRMTTSRRASVSNLMRAVDNYTGDFADALLAATAVDHRTVLPRAPKCDRNRTRRFARTERRLIGFQQRNEVLSAAHSNNLIYLAVCCSYVRSLMHCHDVVAWLNSRYPLHAAALSQIAADTNYAKEPKRLMKLPYTRGTTIGSARRPRATQHGRARAP